jgi:hypothetical protein
VCVCVCMRVCIRTYIHTCVCVCLCVIGASRVLNRIIRGTKLFAQMALVGNVLPQMFFISSPFSIGAFRVRNKVV